MMLVTVSWSRSAQTNLTEASQLLLYIYIYKQLCFTRSDNQSFLVQQKYQRAAQKKHTRLFKVILYFSRCEMWIFSHFPLKLHVYKTLRYDEL